MFAPVRIDVQSGWFLSVGGIASADSASANGGAATSALQMLLLIVVEASGLLRNQRRWGVLCGCLFSRYQLCGSFQTRQCLTPQFQLTNVETRATIQSLFRKSFPLNVKREQGLDSRSVCARCSFKWSQKIPILRGKQRACGCHVCLGWARG